MTNVLVTGGTGFIGSALARNLLDNGRFRVRVMGRDFARVVDVLERGAEAFPADLRDPEAVADACRGCETVYHVGALSTPWTRNPDDYQAINVGGTEAVIAGCHRHGVRRLIYVSSPSVLSNGGNQEGLTDDAPYPARFISAYSASKKVGEDRVNVAFQAGGLETVILRPKAVFGPGDTTLLPRLLASAQVGRLPQIGDGRNRLDLTYIDNAVHALRLAGENPDVAGKTYTITNGEPLPLWNLIRRVLRECGVSDRLPTLSVPAALAVASLLEAVARVTGREPRLTRYTVLLLARTQTHNITAARRELGYSPVVSLEEGVNRTIEALLKP